MFYYYNTVLLLVISYKDIALQIFLTVAQGWTRVNFFGPDPHKI